MKLTSESFSGTAVTLIFAVVGIAATWGSNNARINALEQTNNDQQKQIAELSRSMSRIETDVAVVRQWVDDQKKKGD